MDTVIVWVFYALKSEGASLHNHLSSRMCDLVFKTIMDYPDTWMKFAVNNFGYNYYTYVTTWLYYGMTIINDPRKYCRGDELIRSSIFSIKLECKNCL